MIESAAISGAHDTESQFKVILEMESELSAAKAELQKAEIIFAGAVNAAQEKLNNAWKGMEMLMAETGEYEILMPGQNGMDYKIAWSAPRQSVKVTDIEALPEDLVKIEKKPKLKEIGDRLKEGWQTNAAKFELGERKLTWKAIKST